MCTVPLREAARRGLQLRVALPVLHPWTVRLGTKWTGAVADTQAHPSMYSALARQQWKAMDEKIPGPRNRSREAFFRRARANGTLICRGKAELLVSGRTGDRKESARWTGAGEAPAYLHCRGRHQYVVILGLGLGTVALEAGAGAGAAGAAGTDTAGTTILTVVVQDGVDLSAGRELRAGDRLIVTGTQCEVTIIDPNELPDRPLKG
jgi:hypothetical protein